MIQKYLVGNVNQLDTDRGSLPEKRVLFFSDLTTQYRAILCVAQQGSGKSHLIREIIDAQSNKEKTQIFWFSDLELGQDAIVSDIDKRYHMQHFNTDAVNLGAIGSLHKYLKSKSAPKT